MQWLFSSMVFFLFHAPVYPNIITESKQQFETQSKPTSYACYNRVEGSSGSIQKMVNPRQSDSMICDWDIDVTKGFITELYFEAFELPSSRNEQCGSYIEISYRSQQDGDIELIFCPTDSVDEIYTDSQTVHVKYVYRKNNLEDDVEHLYGFKMNYKAVSVKGTNNAVTITVSCIAAAGYIAAASSIALCFYVVRSHIRSKRNSLKLSHDVLPQAPNAPSRAELQTAVDFYRNTTLAPQNDGQYLSQTSSLHPYSAVKKKKPRKHRAAPPSAPVFQGISITGIASEDEKSPKLPPVKSKRVPSNASADIPSIVIEFVE